MAMERDMRGMGNAALEVIHRGFKRGSGRVVDLDETVLKAQILRHMRSQSRGAVTLGGMVTTSQKCHSGFLG